MLKVDVARYILPDPMVLRVEKLMLDRTGEAGQVRRLDEARKLSRKKDLEAYPPVSLLQLAVVQDAGVFSTFELDIFLTPLEFHCNVQPSMLFDVSNHPSEDCTYVFPSQCQPITTFSRASMYSVRRVNWVKNMYSPDVKSLSGAPLQDNVCELINLPVLSF